MTIEVGQFVIAQLPEGKDIYGFVTQTKNIKDTDQIIHEVLVSFNQDGSKVRDQFKYWFFAERVKDGEAFLNMQIRNMKIELDKLVTLKNTLNQNNKSDKI